MNVDVLGGAQVGAAGGRVLCGEIHACNTFDAPEQGAPQALPVSGSGAVLHVVLPAAAVAAIQINLN